MSKINKSKKFNSSQPFQRDYFIDVLKTVCIIFILIHHLLYFIDGAMPHTATGGAKFGFQFYILQAVPILLIISGYLWTLSYERNKFTKFWEPYKPFYMLKKFIRLFIPYVIAFIIILSVAKATNQFTDYNWWKGFWLGGPVGYGGYYVPIMISLILFLPICWIIVKKWGFKGFVGLYIFNILWEIFRWAVNMDIWVYEVIIFRYTGLIAYGVYLALHKQDKQKIVWSIIGFVVGATYLSVLYYTNYKPIILYADNWRWSNMMTYPYIIPVVGLLIRYCHINNKYVGKSVGFVGVASYSFFLSQNVMLLFNNLIKFNDNQHIQLWINLGFIVAMTIPFYFAIEWLASKQLVRLTTYIENKYKNNKNKKF